MKVDSNHKKGDTKGNFLFINSGEESIKINKADLHFVKVGGHTHHYLPDFTDEWEAAIALKCAIRGCNHGMMHKKVGKEFMAWIEGHRAKAWGSNLKT